ncbi:MAG: hypothetical protein PF487_11495 [Bacteroidales bacterium]|jgi:hypothetical protein|nr:hypothetical protein [Bacteroidales bacterium]
MTKNKLDLNKIKDEIHKEKQSRNTSPSQLSGSVSTGVAPRDEFLHGLRESLDKGVATPSSNLIKNVGNKVATKNGESIKHTMTENKPIQPTNPRKSVSEPVNMSPERDEQLFADLENKRKQTLAESIASYTEKQGGKQQSSSVDFNGTQYLTSSPSATATGQHSSASQPRQMNEEVKNVVNDYLSENLGTVFEEAIKSTVIEMYAVERIKDVLSENKDLIGSVVKDVIREIQAKNKAKQK